jgi:hypothetical protein
VVDELDLLEKKINSGLPKYAALNEMNEFVPSGRKKVKKSRGIKKLKVGKKLKVKY